MSVVLWLVLPESLHIVDAVIEETGHLAPGSNFSLKSMDLVTRVCSSSQGLCTSTYLPNGDGLIWHLMHLNDAGGFRGQS